MDIHQIYKALTRASDQDLKMELEQRGFIVMTEVELADYCIDASKQLSKTGGIISVESMRIAFNEQEREKRRRNIYNQHLIVQADTFDFLLTRKSEAA
ncbi:MAG: hypothetical protein V7727_00260 [Sneathiella sp.]